MERITFIQDMKGLFMGMESFNSELNRWDTSQATSGVYVFGQLVQPEHKYVGCLADD
jgi:hypothetical protein